MICDTATKTDHQDCLMFLSHHQKQPRFLKLYITRNSPGFSLFFMFCHFLPLLSYWHFHCALLSNWQPHPHSMSLTSSLNTPFIFLLWNLAFFEDAVFHAAISNKCFSPSCPSNLCTKGEEETFLAPDFHIILLLSSLKTPSFEKPVTRLQSTIPLLIAIIYSHLGTLPHFLRFISQYSLWH